MAAYRRVYDSRHLQADCWESGSAQETYARQSSMGYRYLFTGVKAEAVTASYGRSVWSTVQACTAGTRPVKRRWVPHHGVAQSVCAAMLSFADQRGTVYVYFGLPVCVLYWWDTGYVQLDAEMRNLSRHERDTVRLRCDITGFPLPKYRWYRHGRPLTPTITSSPASAARLDIRTTPWGSRYINTFTALATTI